MSGQCETAALPPRCAGKRKLRVEGKEAIVTGEGRLLGLGDRTTRWTRRAGLVTARAMRTGACQSRPAGQRGRSTARWRSRTLVADSERGRFVRGASVGGSGRMRDVGASFVVLCSSARGGRGTRTLRSGRFSGAWRWIRGASFGRSARIRGGGASFGDLSRAFWGDSDRRTSRWT
jgi:hypothetical protein